MATVSRAVLVRVTERRIGLLGRMDRCCDSHRRSWLMRHRVEEMVAERICRLALSYVDLNDYEPLCVNPRLGLRGGRREAGARPLAGTSRLNRLDLSG